MRQIAAKRVLASWLALAAAILGPGLSAQSVHEAPAAAPSRGAVAPKGEPGQPLHVSGVVVGPDGSPIGGASLYVYQTDHEGYYGVKPASDNRNPRLKLFLRSDAQGRWAFDTVKPGSYPNSRVPPHIHFEVAGQGTWFTNLRDRLRRRSVRDRGDAQQSGVFGPADRRRRGHGTDCLEVNAGWPRGRCWQ